MLFDTYATQAAQASLDSLWMKTQVIANNMANVDTPNYKAKSVSFEQVLGDATQARSAAQKAQVARASQNGNTVGMAQVNANDPAQVNRSSGGGAAFRTRVTTQDETSVRVDGNNVQLEKEQTELWKSYAQYNYLLDKISGYYSSINSAISNMRT